MEQCKRFVFLTLFVQQPDLFQSHFQPVLVCQIRKSLVVEFGNQLFLPGEQTVHPGPVLIRKRMVQKCIQRYNFVGGGFQTMVESLLPQQIKHLTLSLHELGDVEGVLG